MPKTPEQRILELEAKVKLLEKQKALLERENYISDSKAIIFDMMINIAKKEYKIEVRKNFKPTQSIVLEKKQESLSFTCGLFGVDRKVYYKSIKRTKTRQNVASKIVSLVQKIRERQSRIGTRKLYFMLYEKLRLLKIGRNKFFTILRANHLLY